MPRYPRNNFNSKYFHIMTQGINKNYIFNTPEDIRYYIKLMYKFKEEYNVKIIVYCIMNNHAHFLIKVDKIEFLSNYMHKLNLNYGRYYNKKYNRVGYVFRNRFESQPIKDEKQFYNCIKYIYYNPVKAGICLKVSEYPYSNYKDTYINICKKLEEDDNFIDIKEEKEKNYKEFINNYLKERQIKIEYIFLHKNIAKELIFLLKDKYGISYRKIAEIFKISRESLRRIINN